jgi:hypothetical protein
VTSYGLLVMHETSGTGRSKEDPTAPIFLDFLLHFDAHSFSHAFENDFDGLNNVNLRVCVAVHNHLMFGFLLCGLARKFNE